LLGHACSRAVRQLQRVSGDTPWIRPWRLALGYPCLETVPGKRLQLAGVARSQLHDGPWRRHREAGAEVPRGHVANLTTLRRRRASLEAGGVTVPEDVSGREVRGVLAQSDARVDARCGELARVVRPRAVDRGRWRQEVVLLRLARVVGAGLLVLSALLIIVGIMTLPSGGLMFALPYVFLMPGALFGVVGWVLLRLGREAKD